MMREAAPLPDAIAPPVSRTERIRTLRRELERLEPDLRVLAEDVLASSSRIDLVATDGRRRVVAVMFAEPDGGSRALTTALAHRSWLADHLADWLKIAPDLAIDATSAVRTLLIATDFDPELIAAVTGLPGGWIELVQLVEIARAGQLHSELVPRAVPRRNGSDPGAGAIGRRTTGAQPRFRTGLTARELGLSDEEIAQFE